MSELEKKVGQNSSITPKKFKNFKKEDENNLSDNENNYAQPKNNRGESTAYGIAMLTVGGLIYSCVDSQICSKTVGSLFIGAGLTTMILEGYNPLIISKDILEYTGKTVCRPIDYILSKKETKK